MTGPWEVMPRVGKLPLLVGRPDTLESIGWFEDEARAIVVRDALNQFEATQAGLVPDATGV